MMISIDFFKNQGGILRVLFFCQNHNLQFCIQSFSNVGFFSSQFFFSTGITMAWKKDCCKELWVTIALPFQPLLLLLPQPPFLLIYQSQLKTKKFGNRETCKQIYFSFLKHLSRSAHRTTNLTNPEFQYPESKVLKSVFICLI